MTPKSVTTSVPGRPVRKFASCGTTNAGAVVVTYTVSGIAALPLIAGIDGETEHVACAGAPLHPTDTVWLNPPSGVTVSE